MRYCSECFTSKGLDKSVGLCVNLGSYYFKFNPNSNFSVR